MTRGREKITERIWGKVEILQFDLCLLIKQKTEVTVHDIATINGQNNKCL